MYTEEEKMRHRLAEMNKQLTIMNKTLIEVVDNNNELQSRVELLESEVIALRSGTVAKV
jgi:hypothetical protein